MTNLTLQQELDLDLIHTLLSFVGVECVIAGGFPRDLHFGLEPKDIDVFIHVDDFDQVLNMLEISPFSEKFKVWEPGAIDTRGKPWYTELTHVKYVIKPYWNWLIDFIFIDRPLTQTTDTFDHNINMFILDGTEPKYVGTHPLDTLVCTSTDCTDRRKRKMQEKFKEIVGG